MRLTDLTSWLRARKASAPRSSRQPAETELMELLDEASAVFPSRD